jgi:hypothetical protein
VKATSIPAIAALYLIFYEDVDIKQSLLGESNLTHKKVGTIAQFFAQRAESCDLVVAFRVASFNQQHNFS